MTYQLFILFCFFCFISIFCFDIIKTLMKAKEELLDPNYEGDIHLFGCHISPNGDLVATNFWGKLICNHGVKGNVFIKIGPNKYKPANE